MALLLTGQALAADDPPPPETSVSEDDAISRHRTRFDVIANRTIGTTSVPVEFDWRRSPLHLAATGSFLFELNNFNSLRGGLLARVPTGGFLVEVGASWAGVWDTPSSRMLALTPYRQAGRPERLELDVGLGIPLAEGVVTTFPKFLPAVEMVFSAYGGVRYLVYPTGFARMRAGEVVSAVFSPTLTASELGNLDDERHPAMAVDPGRYGLMFGLGNDLYFAPGLFVSPRFLLAIPLLAPASQTELLLWADFSLAIGVAL